ncbi:MAG: hypothetical protein ACK5PI_01525 [Acetobacteraceae bacterium]|jgi:hypothetical protein
MADTPARQMTPAQRAYEEKRARKAGMSLDRWLALKEKERSAEAAAARKAAEAAKPAAAKAPGFFQRLLQKAEKPLK